MQGLVSLNVLSTELVLDAMSTSDMYKTLLKIVKDETIFILSPVVRQQKGEHVKTIEGFSKQGYSRVRLNGDIHKISDISKHMLGHIIDSKKKNNIEILIDRVDVNEENKLRIIESLNACSDISDGIIYINVISDKKEFIYSTKHACPYCGYSVGKLEPKLFSFNSPAGACQRCDGLGVDEFFDENKIVENPELSLSNGAIAGWDTKNHLYHSMLLSLTKHFKININEKFYKLSKKFKDILFYGSDETIEFDITKLNRRSKRICYN